SAATSRSRTTSTISASSSVAASTRTASGAPCCGCADARRVFRRPFRYALPGADAAAARGRASDRIDKTLPGLLTGSRLAARSARHRLPDERAAAELEKMRALQASAFTRMMDTVNAGDADGYASLYADDAVITIFGVDELRGRDAIEQYE